MVLSPLTMSGSHRCFCSSVPRWVITWAGPVFASKIWKAAGRQTLPNSSIAARACPSGHAGAAVLLGMGQAQEPQVTELAALLGRDRGPVDVQVFGDGCIHIGGHPGGKGADLRVVVVGHVATS